MIYLINGEIIIQKLSDKVGRDLSFKKRGGLKKGGAPLLLSLLLFY
jgi:hypothetical protein